MKHITILLFVLECKLSCYSQLSFGMSLGRDSYEINGYSVYANKLNEITNNTRVFYVSNSIRYHIKTTNKFSNVFGSSICYGSSNLKFNFFHELEFYLGKKKHFCFYLPVNIGSNKRYQSITSGGGFYGLSDQTKFIDKTYFKTVLSTGLGLRLGFGTWVLDLTLSYFSGLPTKNEPDDNSFNTVNNYVNEKYKPSPDNGGLQNWRFSFTGNTGSQFSVGIIKKLPKRFDKVKRWDQDITSQEPNLNGDLNEPKEKPAVNINLVKTDSTYINSEAVPINEKSISNSSNCLKILMKDKTIYYGIISKNSGQTIKFSTCSQTEQNEKKSSINQVFKTEVEQITDINGNPVKF